MHYIELTITAHAPLAIGRQKPGGSVSEAETYIPGSVLRGAIAAQILRMAGQQDTDLSSNGGEFQQLFLDPNAAIFHNAYPAIARLNEHESKRVGDRICVLPSTALSSKENGGFKLEGTSDDEQKGGVFDTVIDRYCAEAYVQNYDPSCPKDKGRVEPFTGFYSVASDATITHKYRRHSTSSRFLTRVGINRRRNTAQDAMLYSLEVLNESFLRSTQAKYPKWNYFVYRSHIWIEDESVALALSTFINAHSDTFRVGGGQSRGLGHVHLSASQPSPSPDVTDLGDRIQAFNSKLQERWQLWSVMGQPTDPKTNSPIDRTFFTIDLQADAILTDHWQRTMVFGEDGLATHLGMDRTDTDIKLKLHAAYTSYDYRTGWNAAWGLPKEMELITNRGAVFLFSIPKKEAWTDQDWRQRLANLEWRGIGDRTTEGFGQVRICDEFHTIFREHAV